jgi:dihydroorotate dehydrogenase
MYALLKVFLFRMDPEEAHHFTMRWFMRLLAIPGIRPLVRLMFRLDRPALERQVAGLTFRNPVGLAAGFDKDGRYLHAMAELGFSHIEVGTVTPRPQPGNPKPRLFRLVRSGALINRMGFNNEGVEALAGRLAGGKPEGLIVGANIGKNKDTPNENAVDDYVACFKRLYGLVDYFTVNVSSPNTPGLRELQDKEPLTRLLATLQANNPRHVPVFLKIAPDLTDTQLDEIVEIVRETGISGVIATNTTIGRSGLQESEADVAAIGAGGLSGAPLLTRSTAVVAYLHARSEGRFAVIGVGGIDSPASAKAHLSAGADLVQVYSGLVYAGPALVRRILRSL